MDRNVTHAASSNGSVANPLEGALQLGTSDAGNSPLRGFAGKLPWAALATTLIVSLRVWSVAHLNLAVALQLVTLTDTSKVLLGLAVVTLPSIMFVVAVYVHLVCTEFLTDAIKSARAGEPVNLPNRSLLFFFLWPPVVVIALAFSSVGSAILILTGILLLTIQRLVTGSKPKAKKLSAEAEPAIAFRYRIGLIIGGLMIAAIGFSMLCFDDTPWLPSEQITLTTGTTMAGYVVADSSAELTILRNRDRNIFDIPSGLIRSRRLCEFSGSTQIAQLFWPDRGPAVPACAP